MPASKMYFSLQWKGEVGRYSNCCGKRPHDSSSSLLLCIFSDSQVFPALFP